MKPIAIYVVLDDAECPRYVGKTFYPHRRKQEHARRFEWVSSIRILEWVEDHESVRWQERERHWIAYYRRFARLENIAGGGGNAGIKSEETKRRFREKMVGRRIPREHVQKMMATRAARTEEERRTIGRRISEAKKGKVPNWSAEGRARTIAVLKRRGSPMAGRTHTAETRRLISGKGKGRLPNIGSFKNGPSSLVRTPEWRDKIGAANQGKVRSQETREKIKQARSRQVINHSADTRRKISEAQRGKPKHWRSDEHKNFLGAWVIRNGAPRKGAVLTSETKHRISESKYSSNNTPRGESHPLARLTTQNVRDIRAKFQPRVYTKKQLASEYGIAIGTIKSILSRRIWSHV